MKKVNRDLAIAMVILCSFIAGICATVVYMDITNQRLVNGMYIPDETEKNAISQAVDLDGLGNWVCVNVKGMEYQKALETCGHEVAHEIFAEYCQYNMSKCIGVTNEK